LVWIRPGIASNNNYTKEVQPIKLQMCKIAT